MLIVRLTLQDEEFCLVNVYAPNDQNQQINFYNELTSKLRPYANENLIMGGDYNCPLENIDKNRWKRNQKQEKCNPQHKGNERQFKSRRYMETSPPE